MSAFSNAYQQFWLKQQIKVEEEVVRKGLRENQVGAVGAILAHFSVRKDPALVSMPTGTGKTAVMIAACYALRASKILVVTPSQMVRKQIAKHFKLRSDLINNEVLSPDSPEPRVYELKNVIHSKAEWDEILTNHDVVVGIPGTLNQIEELPQVLESNAFDVVLVDEAHHSRAKSWTYLLTHFSPAKRILVTATAFRNDKKDLKARLVYNYPLKLAYDRGQFSKIEYIAVETASIQEPTDRDLAIAKKTEEVFGSHQQHGHKIIIRTDSRTRAEQLKQLYDTQTALKLVLIYSKLAQATIDKRMKKLEEGEADGVICVDMMGEGYDFPSLKIAAIHAPHRTLPITLQFVGRISRTNVAAANTAHIVASTHDFEIDKIQLFKDTRDWAAILPELHRARTDRTEEEQHFFDTLEEVTPPDDSYVVDTEEALLLENAELRPFYHTKIYRLIPKAIAEVDEDEEAPDLVDLSVVPNFNGLANMSRVILRHHHVSTEYRLAVFVLGELITPAWYGADDNLKDVKNSLILVYYDKPHNLLYLCSSLKDNELYKELASSYVVDRLAFAEILSLPMLKRILAGWEGCKFYNIGMRSRKAKGSNESYRQLLGGSTQELLTAADAFNYTRGHSFGAGFDSVLSQEMLLGISTSSKVWSIVDGKVPELLDWLNKLSRKISDAEMDNLKSPLTELDCGRDISAFPISNDNALVAADWDGSIYNRETRVAFVDADDEVVEEALLVACEISICREECTTNQLVFFIKRGQTSAKIGYRIKPDIAFYYLESTPCKLHETRGNNVLRQKSLFSLLTDAPINFYFEDWSKLAGRTLMDFNTSFDLIPEGAIQAIAWSGLQVNVNREFYTADDIAANALAGETRLSIHDYIEQMVLPDYDVVYYDHASLEVADILAFRPDSIKFFHCKKQSGDEPRCSVDDIYEVCGQAVKSAVWTNKKVLLNRLVYRNKEGDTGNRVKKGSLDKLREILMSINNPNLTVDIVIVQPGLKTTNHTGTQVEAYQRIKKLFSGAHAYLQTVGSCTLSVLAS
ncbi:DEAD/DEAH box helicase [Hymenobacter jeollabukensis]|uniref:DEAD/DEAH box helicase n=1 Tax=Hymenobacter jeollabukensis TaxID=2025313 RepID=A0A5R8WW69_9BACT|nr:DEAD/DEAH box helicase family protein [Hymenobacter jeollabukensis]TLM95564.1 DEAD/DEAH box helicase [Hymenobacter jeollabukensis]